jgi:hypothetical protein
MSRSRLTIADSLGGIDPGSFILHIHAVEAELRAQGAADSVLSIERTDFNEIDDPPPDLIEARSSAVSIAAGSWLYSLNGLRRKR